MKTLEIRGLKKSYGDFLALKGIDLEVEEGEVFALLGPNGAGKTTLIRILAEGLGYDSGEIFVFGKPLTKETARLVGYVPQESVSYDLLTVEENLKFYADLYDAPYSKIRKLLNEFKLPPSKKARELSGGQMKKLSLAIALLHEPKVLMLDEPSNGLDVPSRRELWNLLLRLRKEGRTILLATHYMEEAERLADRVAIISDGKVVKVGTVEELRTILGNESVIHIEGDLRGLELLKGLEFVEKNGALRIRVTDPRRELPIVIERLIQAGSKIRVIRVEEPTLEDVFVKLTGRELE
ncbi:ATP-binding cassette domain-containing protein [Thermococcus sp.]